MKTANFPRAVIEGLRGQEFPFELSEDDWLISITDFDGEDAKVQQYFPRVLFMKFDDVSDKKNRKGISNEHAREIAQFILEAREQQKNVWVNCHAGICRSGAVVSLLIDLGWEYRDSATSPGRIPNHLVYDKVRKHFPEVSQSWDKPEGQKIWTPAETDIWLAAKGW